MLKMTEFLTKMVKNIYCTKPFIFMLITRQDLRDASNILKLLKLPPEGLNLLLNLMTQNKNNNLSGEIVKLGVIRKWYSKPSLHKYLHILSQREFIYKIKNGCYFVPKEIQFNDAGKLIPAVKLYNTYPYNLKPSILPKRPKILDFSNDGFYFKLKNFDLDFTTLTERRSVRDFIKHFSFNSRWHTGLEFELMSRVDNKEFAFKEYDRIMRILRPIECYFNKRGLEIYDKKTDKKRIDTKRFDKITKLFKGIKSKTVKELTKHGYKKCKSDKKSDLLFKKNT